MENKKMYVITMSTGSYDDYSMQTLFVTEDFEKGTAYVNEHNASYESMSNKIALFDANEHRQWRLDNPRPIIKDAVLKAIPKWKKDEKITKEMRAERKKIELDNHKIGQMTNAPMREWFKSFQQFTNDWLDNNLTEKEREVYRIKCENCWEIQEIAWLK